MSGPSATPVSGWRMGTVTFVGHPSPHAVILRVQVPDRVNHVPGQHYVIRLTAADGYTAQRSYSVASAPADAELEFYIERLDGGEVSPFLAEIVEVGDELEMRGPIGGWFTWNGDEPAFGIAGGAGAVPLVAMARHARVRGTARLLHVAVSARAAADVPYPDELADIGALIALTREDAPSRPAGRLIASELAPMLPAQGTCYVCGSAAFAEGASELLISCGVAPNRIRLERFGPSG